MMAINMTVKHRGKKINVVYVVYLTKEKTCLRQSNIGLISTLHCVMKAFNGGKVHFIVKIIIQE